MEILGSGFGTSGGTLRLVVLEGREQGPSLQILEWTSDRILVQASVAVISSMLQVETTAEVASSPKNIEFPADARKNNSRKVSL